MMRKFSWVLLVLLVLIGCSDEPVLVESAEDLKGVKAKKITWEKDGKEMVFIPSGSFEMGLHNNDLNWDMELFPVHRVVLDPFYMDIHEVTVGQFREFVERSRYNYGGNWDEVADYSPGDEYPMVWVNWNDATAYAKWAGKRLPTEAEWEYAARGGLKGKRYSWGDGEKRARDHANYDGTGGRDIWDQQTAPVGSFYPNRYGLYDMGGNVGEWCADWWGEKYYSDSPVDNPQGPEEGSYRVMRGCSWHNVVDCLRVAVRGHAAPHNRADVGFRCVVSGSNYP